MTGHLSPSHDLSRLRPEQLSAGALVESRMQVQGVRTLTRAIGQLCFLIPVAVIAEPDGGMESDVQSHESCTTSAYRRKNFAEMYVA